MKVQMTNESRRNVPISGVCTSTGFLQRRVDTATRGSLEVTKDVVAETPHNIHV